MKTISNSLRRNIQFYRAYIKAKLLGKKTFNMYSTTWKVGSPEIEEDLRHDLKLGVLKIELTRCD